LVDHDKFDQYGLMTYCSLSEIDFIITDTTPNGSYQKYAKENDIHFIIAN
jgi:DeoR family myo-inositol catabolism operon transcriptional repressor